VGGTGDGPTAVSSRKTKGQRLDIEGKKKEDARTPSGTAETERKKDERESKRSETSHAKLHFQLFRGQRAGLRGRGGPSGRWVWLQLPVTIYL